MFLWGRGCVCTDTKDLDLKSCCMGRRLVVHRRQAWFRMQLHPRERQPRNQAVFLFINPYKSKRDTAGILVKFNPASTSSVTRHKSRHMHLLYDFSERFIVS